MSNSEEFDLFGQPQNPFVDNTLGVERLDFTPRTKVVEDKKTIPLFSEEGHLVRTPILLCKDFECQGKFLLNDIAELTADVSNMKTFLEIQNLYQEFLTWERTVCKRDRHGKG